MAADDFKVISLKLDQLTAIQTNANEKISDIRERLYDPDEGIYARIKEVNSWSELHEKADDNRHNELRNWTIEHSKKDTELRETVHRLALAVEPLAEDYKTRLSKKKWTDKIVWTILAAIISILVPIACHIISDSTETLKTK